MTLRIVLEDNLCWIPLIDLVPNLRTAKGGLLPKVGKWLRRNLPKNALALREIETKGVRRSVLCIEVKHAGIVIIYAQHLRSGNDFRAAWAGLPEHPTIERPARLELSWRNLYRFSKLEHTTVLGTTQKDIAHMRQVYQWLGRDAERKYSWKEAEGFWDARLHPEKLAA